MSAVTKFSNWVFCINCFRTKYLNYLIVIRYIYYLSDLTWLLFCRYVELIVTLVILFLEKFGPTASKID